MWAANDPMALGAITALREAGYKPGVYVVVGGLNWSGGAVERVLKGEMIVTHGGHFLGGAWAMVVLRGSTMGATLRRRMYACNSPWGAIDLPVAQRLPAAGKINLAPDRLHAVQQDPQLCDHALQLYAGCRAEPPLIQPLTREGMASRTTPVISNSAATHRQAPRCAGLRPTSAHRPKERGGLSRSADDR